MVRTHNINPTTIPPRTRMTLHPPHLLFTKIFISPTLTNQLVHAPLIYNPSFTSPPSLIHENIYLSDPYEPTCTCPSHLQPLVYMDDAKCDSGLVSYIIYTTLLAFMPFCAIW